MYMCRRTTSFGVALSGANDFLIMIFTPMRGQFFLRDQDDGTDRLSGFDGAVGFGRIL